MITSTTGQKSPEEEGVDKLIRALTKFEGALAKLGIQHFQERIYRIAKTIKSIDAHKDCYISAFSLDDKENAIPLQLLYEEEINQNNNYMTVNNDILVFQNPETQQDFSLEMADLLSFMENELEISNNFNQRRGDSSDEDDKDIKTTDSSLDLKKNSQGKTHKMKKNIFNIELKLKAFIQQQKIKENLKYENFESFCAQVKLKTPLKGNPKPNPSFIKNFFEESVKDMEIIKKKRLTIANNIINLGLPENSYKKKVVSKPIHSVETKTFQPMPSKKKISDFMCEEIQEQPEPFSNTKFRNSIYKNPYSFDDNGEFIDDDDVVLRDKDDIKSEISEEENNEDDDEYEVVEEEVYVEEEVEVDDDEDENENEKKQS